MRVIIFYRTSSKTPLVHQDMTKKTTPYEKNIRTDNSTKM